MPIPRGQWVHNILLNSILALWGGVILITRPSMASRGMGWGAPVWLSPRVQTKSSSIRTARWATSKIMREGKLDAGNSERINLGPQAHDI